MFMNTSKVLKKYFSNRKSIVVEEVWKRAAKDLVFKKEEVKKMSSILLEANFIKEANLDSYRILLELSKEYFLTKPAQHLIYDKLLDLNRSPDLLSFVKTELLLDTAKTFVSAYNVDASQKLLPELFFSSLGILEERIENMRLDQLLEFCTLKLFFVTKDWQGIQRALFLLEEKIEEPGQYLDFKENILINLAWDLLVISSAFVHQDLNSKIFVFDQKNLLIKILEILSQRKENIDTKGIHRYIFD